MSYLKSLTAERDVLVTARRKYAEAAGYADPSAPVKGLSGGGFSPESKNLMDFDSRIGAKNREIERYASVVNDDDEDAAPAKAEAEGIQYARRADTARLTDAIFAPAKAAEPPAGAPKQARLAKAIGGAVFGGVHVNNVGLMPNRGVFFDSAGVDGPDPKAMSISALNVRAGRTQIAVGRTDDGGRIVLLPEFGGTLLGLLNMPRLTSGDTYRIYRQTTRDEDAAEFVPKRAQKPESGFGYESVDDRVRTLAVLSDPIPVQDLADLPRMRDDLANELANRIIYRLEDAIVHGEQTDADDQGREMFDGILNVTGIREQPYLVSPYRTIRRSLTVLEAAGYDPDALAIALNPLTWEALETEVDENGRPLFTGLYTARQEPVLFGRPVVLSNRIGEGESIVADWQHGVVTLRSDIELAWSDGGDLFETNTVRFRADLRAGFNLSQPGAFVHAQLEPATP